VNDVRPYVDHPIVDRSGALAVAVTQADAWGLSVPRLLRHGMNALYLCGDVVLRVGVTTAPAIASHELAAWLIDAGVPTVPPVEGLVADVDGFTVTGWRFERETRRAVDWSAIGEIVRLVHSLPVGEVPTAYPLPDPSTFPWWQFDRMLADVVDEIDAAALDGLGAAIERRRGWERAVRRDVVLCHGDVHPGNVLMSAGGALLVDWDLMCVANPAWDHGMLTTYAERWGGPPDVYARFAAGYGRPQVDDGLAHALGELRNVAATLMRVRAGRDDPAAAEEAARRLRYWRGEADAPTWRAQ
jgi:hypothetical protein